MAYRPKNRRPFDLPLSYSMKDELYETRDWDGIIYRLPFVLFEGLKNHFKYNQDVKEWYQQLSVEHKKKVQRPNLPSEDLNFNDGEFIE